jgi:methylmalonyl-CoA mutase cobalamin-binding subunit
MHAIHNARIQLLATAFNNHGVGAILAGVVVPTMNGTVGDIAHISAWLALGADVMALAQIMLGRLR